MIGTHGLRPEKQYTSVAVTPPPVRVPTQRPLIPSFTSVVGQVRNFHVIHAHSSSRKCCYKRHIYLIQLVCCYVIKHIFLPLRLRVNFMVSCCLSREIKICSTQNKFEKKILWTWEVWINFCVSPLLVMFLQMQQAVKLKAFGHHVV